MVLNSKKAIVTGGSKGIGRAIALKLAQLGADVAINYNSSEMPAKEVVDEITKLGRRAIALKANVADFTEANEMIKQVELQWDGVDILVNNAGVTKDNLLLKMKEEDWDQVMATNLKSVFNCTKAVTKKMIKQRQGRIINISSVVGIIGNAGQCNYSASKAGIIGFSKTTARELGARGITVNVIAPGYIQTDMTENMTENIKEQLLNQIPIKRLGKPEDIANLAGFLASNESAYITGQVINVDGGMVMI